MCAPHSTRLGNYTPLNFKAILRQNPHAAEIRKSKFCYALHMLIFALPIEYIGIAIFFAFLRCVISSSFVFFFDDWLFREETFSILRHSRKLFVLKLIISWGIFEFNLNEFLREFPQNILIFS